MDDPIILDCDKCGANTVFGPDGLKGSDRIFALPVTWITVLCRTSCYQGGHPVPLWRGL